jgi:hypothetical protein
MSFVIGSSPLSQFCAFSVEDDTESLPTDMFSLKNNRVRYHPFSTLIANQH